ncbi:isopentenyl pyrophosphate isomerase [Erysipelothrix larvae]|uniref:Isopentenyl-diphosphate delta-isomerase n=1 Tax=Erysipelothrix larvae TaxID=1514105 RepID=A0A0X8GYG0_9FIRM|nr:type 2 isopentenyl-diphosphate Delta-isomerase [Erysipelothrix larvae]AMC92736.1 isopentenyl pyrophosphate isomerase [Erysipelothrix larvae]
MRSKRKDEHVEFALKQPDQKSPFESMRLKQNSLPEIDVADVDLSATYLGHSFAVPFYINAMTGGSEKTKEINRKLALIAKKYGLAMAVGSQHAALDDASLRSSYAIVREVNPDGFIMGNVNCNATLEDAQRAIEMIKADALQIHINVAQELTMREGDRTFRHWISHIEQIVAGVDVPVLVKEVGNGMDRESVRKLIEIGVKSVDVSGRGGTNFIWIEDSRNEKPRYDYLKDWGMSTLESLLDNQVNMHDVEFLASGGVKTPLDVIKCLVLGAHGVGISKMFLDLAVHDDMDLDGFIEDLKHIMVMLNKRTLSELTTVHYVCEDIQWRHS